MILLGSVFSFILSFIAPIFYPLTLELRVIGWVIPGLIANTFERQGFLVTTAAMALTVTIIYFIGQLYFLLI